MKVWLYLTLFFFVGLENGNAKVEKTSSSHHQTFNISNEVFEEEELSSRTVSEYDKISTITEVSCKIES